MTEYYNYTTTHDENSFSILIPTWNNLELLKLCIHSIRKNSHFSHEIIVHVNENSDNTKKWLEEEKISHSLNHKNVGVCQAVNASYSLSSCDYVVYLNDDMYVLPDWDVYLWEEISKIGHSYFYLSASLIEPRFTGNLSVSAPFDFGRSPKDFREKELLDSYSDINIPDRFGSTWPPSLMHRKMWNLIGGYSIEYTPGMYSDPDISMKLWFVGVRYFKICGKSRVYHFMSKSTGKVKRNNGRLQFFKKWNISSSTFYKFYLRMGKEFDGILNVPEKTTAYRKALLKDKIKRYFRS